SRARIYGGFTEVGAGAWSATAQTCNGWYWTEGFGDGGVAIPFIPAGSAMYLPPLANDSSELYFAANYYDPSGNAPKRAEVVVSGHCFDLDRNWGYDDNGTYEARFADPDVLPQGCHPYYFLFDDAAGARHTYPDTGSLMLPIGAGQSCPVPYDPSAQKPADCVTGVQSCPAGASQACYTADT